MVFAIKLNYDNVKSNYVKVVHGKKQYIIGKNPVEIPEDLFNKLLSEQPNNFIFYKDRVVVNAEVGKSETSEISLEGTIEEKKPSKKKKRKKIFKKLI